MPPCVLVFNFNNFASIFSSKINLLVESIGNAKILNNPAYAVVTKMLSVDPRTYLNMMIRMGVRGQSPPTPLEYAKSLSQ